MKHLKRFLLGFSVLCVSMFFLAGFVVGITKICESPCFPSIPKSSFEWFAYCGMTILFLYASYDVGREFTE